MKTTIAAFALALASAVDARIVWDGNFNNYASSADFDKWSWSNQVGAYQWYIHGSQSTSNYLVPGTSYKNPAETDEVRGLKLSLDSSSSWNGQSMMRTELIPQSSANLGTGTLYYQFSFKRTTTNAPTTSEHQIFFFESHFTEFKLGVGSDKSALQWFVGGTSRWSTAFTADTWFNFAYEINFSSNTVGLWASTGGNPLTKVVNNVSASTSTNSADFHVGVLKFDQTREDWYISGVFISDTIVTAIGSGSSTPISTTSTSVSTPVSTTPGPSTSNTPSSSSTAPTTSPTATVPLYGQCGGTGYNGPTTCAPPAVCKVIADPWYSQCLNP